MVAGVGERVDWRAGEENREKKGGGWVSEDRERAESDEDRERAESDERGAKGLGWGVMQQGARFGCSLQEEREKRREG
eukprot:3436585-Pleurochrysis_carterae.AAC.2